MSDHSRIAQQLLTARRSQGFVRNGALTPASSLEDALAIQDIVLRHLDERIAAWKVALPADGVVLSAPIYASAVFGSGISLPLWQYLKDGVECELAFRLTQPLPARPVAGYRIEDVRPALGEAMAAFELLHSRLEDGFQSPRAHVLADNLGNGGVVLGSARTDWRSFDLADISVALDVNGKTLVERRGGNPLGDPLRAVVALANHLAERGLALVPGQVVMTGSYTGVHRAAPGELLRACFEGFAPVAFTVSAADEAMMSRQQASAQ